MEALQIHQALGAGRAAGEGSRVPDEPHRGHPLHDALHLIRALRRKLQGKGEATPTLRSQSQAAPWHLSLECLDHGSG